MTRREERATGRGPPPHAGGAGGNGRPAGPAGRLRLGVLLSGGGRTLENLAAKIRQGELPAEVALVVSSHPGAHGVERARRHGLPVDVIDWREAGAEFSSRVTEALDRARADLVVMAGLVRRWDFPERYAGRVLNIHPALLPAFGGRGFYGERVHRAVLAAGARTSGCTVHFVDGEYDHGPVVLQRVVPVLPDDTHETLAERVFAEECIAYPQAIRLYAEGRLDVRGGRVHLRSGSAEEGSEEK